MDKLACIQAFIASVQEGSLHQAAQKLCQTDAAISKKISKLEQSINTRLLDRKRGKLKLTEIGSQYYIYCQEALDKLDAAKEFIATASNTPHGKLRVVTNRHQCEAFLIPKLKGFLERYPAIRLTIHSSETVPDFSTGEIDILFGIAMNIPHEEKLVRKQINRTRSIVCATPHYLRDSKINPNTPEDLLKLRYLCHSGQYPLDLISFDNGFNLRLTPFIHFDDAHASLLAALQHLGFISIKEYKAESYLKTGELIEILADYNQTELPIYVYYHQQYHMDPKIRVFLDYFA